MSDQEEESKWKQVLEGSKKLTKKQKQKRKKEFTIPKADGGLKRRLKNPYANQALQGKNKIEKSSSEEEINDNEDEDESKAEMEKLQRKKEARKLKKLLSKEKSKEMEESMREEEKKIQKLQDEKQMKANQQKIEIQKKRQQLKESQQKQQWKETLYIILFFIGFIVCTGALKYHEEKFRKFEKYNLKAKFGNDLYEILQIDSQASLQDIKKSYKKLVVAWHPDKNPDCGQKCSDKFQEITNAYEVLSNEEKRRSYDESSGAWAHIRSKAVTLTEQNFDRLVEDSNDVWIIEAYEDGNSHCERMADFWEELIMQFDQVGVQFGRINIETQNKLTKRLPFHIIITPTIFSLVKGYEPEIYSYDYMNLLPTLKQFVINSLHDEVKLVNDGEFQSWFQEIQQGNAEANQVPELFLPSQHNHPSPYFKYNAIKYKDVIKLLSNSFGFYKKVRINNQFD